MKIWEALIYGLVAGLTGLLPVSFSGHAAVLQDAFALSPLTQGGGLYIRAAITLGLSAALVLAFPGELQLTCGELARRPQRGKRARQPSPRRRAVLMGLLALPIGLLSLIWCAAAERITRLSLIAAFFCLNGLILFAAGRPGGQKDARALMLPDALLACATRLAAVLPGLSPLGLTLAVCRLRDLRTDFALRFTAMLTASAFRCVNSSTACCVQSLWGRFPRRCGCRCSSRSSPRPWPDILPCSISNICCTGKSCVFFPIIVGMQPLSR